MFAESSLCQLPMGHSGKVLTIGGTGSFRRRLMEMGLTPGVEVRLLKRAPMGDPLEIEVRGARLSIRSAEAATLEVEPLPPKRMASLRSSFSRVATS